MVMGQQEPIEPSKAGAAAQQLALRPFSAVDEDAMAPRLHQKARMVAFSRWNARRRPQEGEREHGGPTSLPLSVVVVEDAHALVFSDETVSWSGRLARLLGRLLRRLGLDRGAADAPPQRLHQVDDVARRGPLHRRDGLAGALAVDEIHQRGFVVVLE